MRLMKANVFTAQELCEATIQSLEKNKHLNAYVTYRDQEVMMKEAEAAQLRIEKSKFRLKFNQLSFKLGSDVLI